MSKGLARKLLVLFSGVLLVLLGILYQLQQNESPQARPEAPRRDMASVLTASLYQQRRYFQRCWLRGHSLATPDQMTNPEGDLTWQIFLKIEPTGKVTDFTLLNKALFDFETEKCLKEISFRLKFPSFEGAALSITVPIVISQLSENR